MEKKYLVCERSIVYELLMMSAGMMGAYTYAMRGGVFCNAQTANVVLMAMAFGQKQWIKGIYFFIPITAYLLGSFLSELLPTSVRKIGLFRWDTYLVLIEILVLIVIGFIPLSMPHQIVQVTINFICSMQYNTFRQAQGIPMATTFCTNHIRQVGTSAAKFLRKKQQQDLNRGLTHFKMMLCFIAGGIILTAFCQVLKEKAIWLAAIPLLIDFCMLAHADLNTEHDLLERKPAGH